ncbi:AMP-binding protein [Salsuginibacillus halophilus]|nr:AMP-binding protein [Salsuginibacillus halophilus]
MNIADQLAVHAQTSPNKTAVVIGSTKLTYAELNDSANQSARGLAAAGAAGQHTALHAANHSAWIQMFFGALRAGSIPVIMDPAWRPHETEDVLQRTQPAVILTDQPGHITLPETSAVSPQILTTGDHASFQTWISEQSTNPILLSNQHQTLLIGFTSGTTGHPKGYMRTHRSWIESFFVSNPELGLTGEDTIIVPGPLSHSLNLYALVHALILGATVELLPKFQPGNVLNALKRHASTVLFLVPTLTQSVLNKADRTRENIRAPKAIICSGAKWTEASKQQAEHLFPETDIFEFYGSSEASFVSLLTPAGRQAHPETVGRPFERVHISIRDDDGSELSVGQTGRLHVKSPLVFSGYYGDDEATNQVCLDGWVKMSEYARLNHEGFLTIAGRAENMIVSGGLNVYPEEVETVLKLLPEVTEAVVTHFEDSFRGERICAYVMWHDEPLTLQQLKTHCRTYLSDYKVPHQLESVTELPYTPSGKVARSELQPKEAPLHE